MREETKGRTWKRLSVVWVATILVLGMTTVTIADYHEDKCAEDGGEQYGESDCSGVDCRPYCQDEEPEFDSDENLVCDTGDTGFIVDQDGDGEVDCMDNDNDGDLLTDELEYKTRPYNMNDAYTDGAIRDDWDIVPNRTDFELAGVDMPRIDLADDTCDGDPTAAPDPYIRHYNRGEDNESTTLKVFYGANGSSGFDVADETLLDDPEGWSKENHVDNRNTDPFNPDWTLDGQSDTAVGPGAFDNHRYSLPHNVSSFNVDEESDEPAIGLTFGLKDHDEHWGGDDEEIDLANGAPLNAEFTYELHKYHPNSDPLVTKWTDPDATCFAKVKAEFDDHVFKTTNDIAVYRGANPQEMIYTDTV